MVRIHRSGLGHIVVGVALLGFGALTIFSIGFPVITIGLIHLALYPTRHRRAVYQPVMHGAMAFWVGFALVAPMWCTTTVMGEGVVSSYCRSLAGIRYPEEPSLVLGWMAAIAAGLAVAAVSRRYQLARLPPTGSS